MPGRKFNSGNYRFGFNGKENDREISDGIQNFGARLYDGRIGRFLSVDPLIVEFPWETPYSFASNHVITHIDFNGENPIKAVTMAWKAIKKYRRASKKGKSFNVREFLKEEAEDIIDNVLTIVDPQSSWFEIASASADLTLGVDFRTTKGRRVKKLLGRIDKQVEKAGIKMPSILSTRIKKKGRRGRGGRQKRLRELQGEKNKYGRRDRGWQEQEGNRIKRGKSKHRRNSPGKELSHPPGKDAKDGHDYSVTEYQTVKGHKTRTRAQRKLSTRKKK
jgi:RHS repeat-associated protein